MLKTKAFIYFADRIGFERIWFAFRFDRTVARFAIRWIHCSLCWMWNAMSFFHPKELKQRQPFHIQTAKAKKTNTKKMVRARDEEWHTRLNWILPSWQMVNQIKCEAAIPSTHSHNRFTYTLQSIRIVQRKRERNKQKTKIKTTFTDCFYFSILSIKVCKVVCIYIWYFFHYFS